MTSTLIPRCGPPHARKVLDRRMLGLAMGATIALVTACATEPPAAAPAPTDRPAPAAEPAPAPVAVAQTTLDLTDPRTGRPLPTRVHHPAGPGPFPLVLMAHGYNLSADGYGPLLDRVAARGYVVAAPDFPHTSSRTGDGDRSDLVNQPGYLAAVADGVVAASGRPAPTVPTVAHPERLAAMGHSDGGLTAAAIAFNDTYRDDRVAAAVVLTGGTALFPGGWSVPDAPPLLAVHGRADGTNPPSASTKMVSTLPATAPRYLVHVDGGDHIGPYMGDSSPVVLADTIADFLDVHLQGRGDPAAVERFRRDAGTPPLSLSE
jgi:predicted dienelactone hydrolase